MRYYMDYNASAPIEEKVFNIMKDAQYCNRNHLQYIHQVERQKHL